MNRWILVMVVLAFSSAACSALPSPTAPTQGQSAGNISGNTNSPPPPPVDAPPPPPVGALTLFADNFNRADSPDLGASWDSGYIGEGPLRIVGNKVRATKDWDTSAETVAISLPNDQWAQFRLGNFFSGAGAVASVLLRVGGPGPATWYEFVAGQNLYYTSRIAYRVAGVNTTQVTETATTWATGDVIRAEAIGTTLNLYRNGALLLTMTDPNLASGRAGIRLLGPNTPEVQVVDDFSAGGF